MKEIVVFAKGQPNPEHGGKGFRYLVESARNKTSDLIGAEVSLVVSDYVRGGVWRNALDLNVPFKHLNTAESDSYRKIVDRAQPDLVIFLGWSEPVIGLDPSCTLAVHRGLHGGGYLGGHQVDAAAYMGGGTVESTLSVNFVLPGEFRPENHIEIISIPVYTHIGPEIQPLPGRDGKGQKISGSPQERIARMMRWSLRDAQRIFLPPIVQHVLTGRVQWRGENKSPMVPNSYE